jgi:hypothetical protein
MVSGSSDGLVGRVQAVMEERDVQEKVKESEAPFQRGGIRGQAKWMGGRAFGGFGWRRRGGTQALQQPWKVNESRRILQIYLVWWEG